jgi:hypothetical protein
MLKAEVYESNAGHITLALRDENQYVWASSGLECTSSEVVFQALRNVLTGLVHRDDWDDNDFDILNCLNGGENEDGFIGVLIVSAEQGELVYNIDAMNVAGKKLFL